MRGDLELANANPTTVGLMMVELIRDPDQIEPSTLDRVCGSLQCL